MKSTDDYIFKDGDNEDFVQENNIYAEFTKFLDDCENGRVTPYQCRTGCNHHRKDQNTFIEYCSLSGERIKGGRKCKGYENKFGMPAGILEI